MEINTDRLMLRPVSEDDYSDICEYGCDEETGQYMQHWPKDRIEIRQFIQKCIAAMTNEEPAWFEYAMHLKSEKKVIGNISIVVEGEEGEIGWISNKKYWYMGYMTEALRSLIPHVFANLDLKRLYATCAEKNAPSIRVMEKCGMKKTRYEPNLNAHRKGGDVIFTRLTFEIVK